jgi:hypothetical protein
MADALHGMPRPLYGLVAVLLRFIGTSLTTVLFLHILGRLPFAPSELVRLPIEKYYSAEVWFLPAWGIGIWLLMASVSHLILRVFKAESDFDHILNIIGIGMLVPMPLLWIWDWTAIILGIYAMNVMAVTHTIAQLWEATIESICFIRVLRIRPIASVATAVLINGVYVALAIVFIR